MNNTNFYHPQEFNKYFFPILFSYQIVFYVFKKVIRKFRRPDGLSKTLYFSFSEKVAPTLPACQNGGAYSRATHRRGIPHVSSSAYPTSGAR